MLIKTATTLMKTATGEGTPYSTLAKSKLSLCRYTKPKREKKIEIDVHRVSAEGYLRFGRGVA